jgi:hypothetical protein
MLAVALACSANYPFYSNADEAEGLQEESSEGTDTSDETANVEGRSGTGELGVARGVDASAGGSRGAGAGRVAGASSRRRSWVTSALSRGSWVAGAGGELGGDLSGRVGSLGGGGAGRNGGVLAVGQGDGLSDGDDGRALLWMFVSSCSQVERRRVRLLPTGRALYS